jgi:hypothetical protein
MFGWWRYRRYQRQCPHPSWAIRFIHGDERFMGYASQCTACGKLFR